MTKKERNIIYESALAWYHEQCEKRTDTFIGLCKCLAIALLNNPEISEKYFFKFEGQRIIGEYYIMMEHFTEVTSLDPKTRIGCYWFGFSDEDQQKRIAILEKSIALTK